MDACPQDLKDAKIVHLYKGKGDKSNCDNCRGIPLLVIAGKIQCKAILNRLNTYLSLMRQRYSWHDILCQTDPGDV
jgi:hypothetical protein